MKLRFKPIILWLAAAGLLLVIVSRGEAIPVFARKYKTACTTCHVAIPKLNAFGKAFRMNGYRFPKETRGLVDEKPVPLGGEPQKKLFPKKAVYPGEIPGTVPLAIRLMSDVGITPQSEVKSDFRLPHEVELLSGGNLGESISFFVEIAAYEDGEFGGLERAFLQFNRLIWSHPLLNIKIGQMEPAAVPFTRIRRFTVEHYLTSRFQNGSNRFRFKDTQRGIEVWGIRDGAGGGGLFYAMGVVNGNGSGGKGSANTLDNNSAKDFYGRLRYKFGGLSLTGEKGPPPQGGSWVDNSITIGGYGYKGWSPESRFHRWGVDFQGQFKNLDLFGTWMWGKDSFSTVENITATQLAFTAYFVEADYLFLPWIIGALRYGATYTPDDPDAPDLKEIMVNLTFSIRPNIGLRMEAVGSLDGSEKTRGRLRLDVAF